MSAINIRPEQPEDAAAVHALVTAAFAADEDTARFVAAVRKHAVVCLAEVAVSDGVVGHAQWCLAPLTVDGRPVAAAYLTCLCVAPGLQKTGIGSLLLRGGLDRLRQAGIRAASLLGDPDYYGRFGFSSELAARIEAPHRAMGRGFQAVELIAGALNGATLRSDFPAVIAPAPDAAAP